MLRRFIEDSLLAALSDTPVVLLHGARQTGKSTLVQHLATTRHPSRYLTLDDATALAAARDDAAGFLSGLEGPVVIDEIQRAPELFLAIKAEVDRSRRPGCFLLTGSANAFMVPRLSETLAGRMEILTLWPFSQGELAGAGQETFVDSVFGDSLPSKGVAVVSRAELQAMLVRGGYPPAVERLSQERRGAWFGSYITTILDRDVRDLAHIEGLTALPRLLALLAARAASLLNASEVSRNAGIPNTTLKRYFALLEATFLVQLIPAWSTNLGKRLVKAPKIVLNDTGLIAYLLGLDETRLSADPRLLGSLVENFVAMELRKQTEWSRRKPRLFHYRPQAGHEVDLVLEDPGGDLAGVEVKASATVTGRDFQGLRTLAELAGARFRRGIVLYTGAEALSFGPNLHALPIAALWSGRARGAPVE